MIGIRECIAPAELERIKNVHVTFVSIEVKKRIDFYIQLFETVDYLQANPLTRVATIHAKVHVLLHPKQFVPFMKVIFTKPRKTFNYNELKDLTKLKLPARPFALVLVCLRSLRKSCESLIGLDLTGNQPAHARFYEKCKLAFAPIDFLLDKIFDYPWFRNLQPVGRWNAYKLTAALGTKVCCYCNRQYTFTLVNKKKKVTRPELDHFLPQFENKLLSLSFFNLVPSCSICNSDCKGKTSFSYGQYLSPYEANVRHGLMSYDYFPKTYLGAIGETDEILVFVKTSGLALDHRMLTKVSNNIKIFEHRLMVNEHRDVVREIIRKRHISNDQYIETLQRTFPLARLTLDEAYRLAYGNFYEENEFHKRPLAKLTKDIAIHIGALKVFRNTF